MSDDAGFITGQTFSAEGGLSSLHRKRSGTDVEGVDYQKKH